MATWLLRLFYRCQSTEDEVPVLHKCANPGCESEFRRLKQGKLFLVETPILETSPALTRKRERTHRIEHYWLCDQCASIFTLAYERGRGIVTVPLPEERTKIPARSDWGEGHAQPSYFERSFLRRA